MAAEVSSQEDSIASSMEMSTDFRVAKRQQN